MSSWFTTEIIDKDTFAISEYRHWEETHCYLLCGTKKAMFQPFGGRKVYIHINNTNPVLQPEAPERKALEAAGWALARDGMEITV